MISVTHLLSASISTPFYTLRRSDVFSSSISYQRRLEVAGLSHLLGSLWAELMQNLVLMDLDPGTAKLAIAILGPFLSAFSLLFIVRIVMSWYSKLPVGKLTRKVIPPLGGVDVTPVVWFGLMRFLNEILVGPQGLLCPPFSTGSNKWKKEVQDSHNSNSPPSLQNEQNSSLPVTQSADFVDLLTLDGLFSRFRFKTAWQSKSDLLSSRNK